MAARWRSRCDDFCPWAFALRGFCSQTFVKLSRCCESTGVLETWRVCALGFRVSVCASVAFEARSAARKSHNRAGFACLLVSYMPLGRCIEELGPASSIGALSAVSHQF